MILNLGFRPILDEKNTSINPSVKSRGCKYYAYMNSLVDYGMEIRADTGKTIKELETFFSSTNQVIM